MADRSTKTFTTPGGHEVVMYDYITGGETQAVARKAPTDDKDLGGQLDAGNEAIKFIVLSLDGSAENVFERVLELPFADYKAVSDEVSSLFAVEKKS